MKVETPIITSMLDDDLYKLNMGSVVFHMFPKAIVNYDFINRGKTVFPPGFAEELQHQVNMMSNLSLTDAEAEWLNKIPYLRPTYVEWLKGYRMNPKEVIIWSENGLRANGYPEGTLKIGIHGPWYRTIYWEVKLMAIISELYFRLTGQSVDSGWLRHLINKGNHLADNGCHWIDFGTRRRYSLFIQDQVVRIMSRLPGFLGTSNPFLAMKYGVTPHGTFAHESVMAMSALYGVRMANKMWMKHWSDHFEGNVGVSLTDTFTTDVFLRDFSTYEARLFDGARQDSDDPYKWADNKMLPHYKKLGIQSTNKRFVFSDSLDVGPRGQRMVGNNYNYVELDRAYRSLCQPCGGIGTKLSNDVGVKPLNMVIKMTGADFGHGMIDVVKLSDSPGKHTGNPDAIAQAKRELGLE